MKTANSSVSTVVLVIMTNENERMNTMNKIYKILGKRGRITIPYELRVRHGYAYNDIISFEDTGKGILVKREKVCSNCHSVADKPTDEITLLEFLDGLSPEEQTAALYLLAVVVGKQADTTAVKKIGGTAHA